MPSIAAIYHMVYWCRAAHCGAPDLPGTAYTHLQGCQEGLYKLLRVLQVLIDTLAHEGIPEALEYRVCCLQNTLCIHNRVSLKPPSKHA